MMRTESCLDPALICCPIAFAQRLAEHTVLVLAGLISQIASEPLLGRYVQSHRATPRRQEVPVARGYQNSSRVRSWNESIGQQHVQ